jgi:hypothetical protein
MSARTLGLRTTQCVTVTANVHSEYLLQLQQEKASRSYMSILQRIAYGRALFVNIDERKLKVCVGEGGWVVCNESRLTIDRKWSLSTYCSRSLEKGKDCEPWIVRVETENATYRHNQRGTQKQHKQPSYQPRRRLHTI